MNKIYKKKSISIFLALIMAFTLLFSAMPTNFSSVFAASNVLETTEGANSYTLFNSGRTGSRQRYSSSSPYNKNTSSLNNGGYDFYASYSSMKTIRLGLGFKVNYEVTEKAFVTIYAYDVDEKDGERDLIYLVDENTGARTKLDGYLHGQDEMWNTTTLEIAPSYFTTGHTYHFELTESVSGWVVYVRNVALQLTCGSVTNIEVSADFTASISSSGRISTTLNISSTEAYTYTLEYAANYGYNQYGAGVSSITSSPSGAVKEYSFQLNSGAPKGVYTINVLIKDSSGNVKLSKSVEAGYAYYSVSYHSNGGSNNLPSDKNAYSAGNTVNVLFNYLPSRAGYIFLGWSTDQYATSPMYTKNGLNSFTIGSSSVNLYAVWEEEKPCEHENTKWVILDPATCMSDGTKRLECVDCGEYLQTITYAGTHEYEITTEVEATCTEDGYIIMTCKHDGCEQSKQQTLIASGHDFGRDNICDKCGFARENHEHNFTQIVVEPECTKVGYTINTCSCGYSYRDNYVDQKGHDWDEGEITVEATCTTDGLIVHHCLECSATLEIPIEAAHDWEERVTKQATCTEDGEMERTCLVCGESETVVIPAGHDWDEGTVVTEPGCMTDGVKTCTCLVCGTVEDLPIKHEGHRFVNGSCQKCGARIPDIVNPDNNHPEYGMYFEIEDIISDYGPDYINEYGVLLDYNKDANIKKVAVYLTQDGTMWRRCIACVGEGITYATYVPYLSYEEEIKYTGLNHEWINIFRLSKNSDNIWCYSDYATIGVNLQDYTGRLLLSLYDIGQAGAKTRVFDNLEEMIDWLKEDSDCINHTESEWITDKEPTVELPGSKHTECTKCGQIMRTEEIPVKAQVTIANVVVKAGGIVDVTVEIKNNPGIIGAIISLTYDSDLTLIEAKAGKAWTKLDLTLPGQLNSPCNFVWDAISEEDDSNGSLIVLTFKVPEGVATGTKYGITMSYQKGNIINSNYEDVELIINNGSITVDSLIGDINEDGFVDVADIVMLRRYLAGGYNVSINEEFADVNQDGEITIADVVMLRRYVAGGYGVEL